MLCNGLCKLMTSLVGFGINTAPRRSQDHGLRIWECAPKCFGHGCAANMQQRDSGIQQPSVIKNETGLSRHVRKVCPRKRCRPRQKRGHVLPRQRLSTLPDLVFYDAQPGLRNDTMPAMCQCIQQRRFSTARTACDQDVAGHDVIKGAAVLQRRDRETPDDPPQSWPSHAGGPDHPGAQPPHRRADPAQESPDP